MPKSKSERSGAPKRVAIYEVMRPDDEFDDIAARLFALLRSCARTQPRAARALYLDIEGHRNDAGGFDRDAYELQNGFVLGFLSPFLAQITMPLISIKNPHPQSNDLPDEMRIVPAGPPEARGEALRAAAKEYGAPVWDAEAGEFVEP